MTAIEQIVNWVNQPTRPVWWKHAVRLTLIHQCLDAEHLELLYQISRMEVRLDKKDDSFHTYESPVSAEGFIAEEKPVALQKIGPVINVSSLTSDQELEFTPKGLNVVYGDNGSGKSSYAKILKNACLTRGELPQILGNIFTVDQTPSSAMIYLQSCEEITATNWEYGKESLADLKSIRVFDSTSATHYIEKEGIIEYKPAGLHVLDELNQACEYVKGKLTADMASCALEWARPDISQITNAGQFLDGICEKTTEDDIKSFCATKDELQQLELDQVKLNQLKTSTPEELRKRFQNRINQIAPLLAHLNSSIEILSDEILNDIARKKDDYYSAIAVAEQLREQTFTGLPLPGTGNEAWKIMWKATFDYVESMVPEHEFPVKKGGHCPLCMQEVGSTASRRLSSFNEFIASTAQQKVVTSLQSLKDAQRLLHHHSINFSPYFAVIEELNAEFPSKEEDIKAGQPAFRLRNLLEAFKEQIEKRCKEAGALEPVIIQLDKMNTEVVTTLTNLVNDLQEQLSSVRSDEEAEKAILTLEQNCRELEAKKVIGEARKNIINEVSRLSTHKKLKEVDTSCKTPSITRLSTVINTELVTSQLRDAFSEELQLLGFKSYNVEAVTRGDRVNQKFKIKLESENSPKISMIASEGEGKCLALAGIFAELKVDGRQSGVIFDDPVNSLDHKWRRKIAKRLVDEARNRQVIVFTHDLTFLKMLEEIADDITVKALTRTKKSTGIPQNIPPWDALKTQARIGWLKSEEQRLRAVSNKDTEAVYSEEAKRFYGKKRETWERLLEEWLIKGVVERFSRSVKTQSVRYLTDISEEDVSIIDDAMSKCSCIFDGHDTADELGIDIPEIDELKSDIDALDEYFKGLKKRRSR